MCIFNYLHVCVHAYVYTYIYIHVNYIYIWYTYLYTYIYMYTFIYIYIQVFSNIHRCIHIYIYVYYCFYMHTYVICSKSSRILQVSCAEVFGTFEGLLKLRVARGIWKTRVSFIYLHHTLAINVGDSPFRNKGFFNVGILYHPTISGNHLKHGTPPRNKKLMAGTWK